MVNLEKDLTSINSTFPFRPKYIVDRTNLIDLTTSKLQNLDMIIIDGDSGCGKSELAAQFCEKYKENSLSLFVKASNIPSYDCYYVLFEFANQIQYLSEGNELELSQFEDNDFTRYQFKLNKYIKKKKFKNFYLVVDGIDSLETEKFEKIAWVFNALRSIDTSAMKLIVTGDRQKLCSFFNYERRFQLDSMTIPNLTKSEVISFLNENEHDDSELIDLFYLQSKGNPQKLNTLINIYKNKEKPDISKKEQPLEHLFKILLEQFIQGDSQVEEILALLTHCETNLEIKEIAEILSLSMEKITPLLKTEQVLQLNSGYVIIEPESLFKHIKKTIPQKYEKIVLEKMVIYITEKQGTDSKLTSRLYKYYFKLDKHKEVLNFLSPAYCSELIKQNPSSGNMGDYTRIGMESATAVGNYNEIMRFSLLQSILSGRGVYQIYSLEVEARLSIGDIHGAFYLANSAFLVEDKLKLTALILNRLFIKNLLIPEEIHLKIKELVLLIDVKNSIPAIIETVNLLIDVDPHTAIDLLEKVPTNKAFGSLQDWILSQISMEKLSKLKYDGEESDSKQSQVVEKIASRINNKGLRELLSSINTFSRNKDSNAILKLIESSDMGQIKIMLLRIWLASNPEQVDLSTVMTKALDIIIGSTQFVINASVLLDVSKPLKAIQDENARLTLVERIRKLTENENCRRPSTDYIRLSILLAESEFSDTVQLNSVYQDILANVNESSDLETKISGWTSLLASIEQSGKLSLEINKLKNLLEKNVLNQLDANLSILASQERLFDSIFSDIQYCSDSFVQKIFAIIPKVNTQYRRELIYINYIKSYLVSNTENKSNTIFKNIFGLLHSRNAKRIYISTLFDFIDINPERFKDLEIQFWLSEAEKFSGITQLLDIYSCILKLTKIRNADTTETDKYIKAIYSILDTLDSSIEKIHVLFYLAKGLSDEFPELVSEFISEISKIKQRNSNTHWATHSLLITNSALLIRVLIGLLGRVSDINSYIKETSEIIESNFDGSNKLELFVDMAERFYLAKEKKIFEELLVTKIITIVEQSKDSDRIFFNNLSTASRVIYLHHNSTYEEYLNRIDDPFKKDQIILNTIEFFLSKCSLFDDCDISNNRTTITFDECLDIIKLAKNLKTDHILSSVINRLIDLIHQNRKKLSRTQLLDLSNGLEKFIDEKFPDSSNIQHDGYEIYLKSMLLKLDTSQYVQSKYEQLNIRASKIPNVSDSIFVKIMILSSLSDNRERFEQLIKKITKEIQDKLTLIESFQERIEKFQLFTKTLYEIDRSSCKKYLKDVFTEIYQSENNLIETQKNFIDLAYKIDPNLAEKLISLYDDDPAREESKEELTTHLLKIKSQFDFDIEKIDDAKYLPEISSILLRELNSNLKVPKTYKFLVPFIKKTSDLSYEESYPTFALVIEHVIRSYKGTKAANESIIGLFNNLKFSLNLISILEQNDVSRTKQLTDGTQVQPHGRNIVIKAGERTIAEQWLKNWIQNTLIDDIIIIDPFFEKEDLVLLSQISEINPEATVKILSGFSNSYRKDNRLLKDDYKMYWDKISHDLPPETDFIFVGREPDMVAPFHDRYWIVPSANKGLRLGGSYNFLGISKSSEISTLDESMISQINKEIIDQFINKQTTKLANGVRLVYNIFGI